MREPGLELELIPMGFRSEWVGDIYQNNEQHGKPAQDMNMGMSIGIRIGVSAHLYMSFNSFFGGGGDSNHISF